MADYLSAVLEDGDAALLAAALGDVARARGMAEIAKASGLSREALYKALRPDASPRLDTIVRGCRALGVKLVAQPLLESSQRTTRRLPRAPSKSSSHVAGQPRSSSSTSSGPTASRVWARVLRAKANSVRALTPPRARHPAPARARARAGLTPRVSRSRQRSAPADVLRQARRRRAAAGVKPVTRRARRGAGTAFACLQGVPVHPPQLE